jgi:methionine-R-sulfoxide reductase
MFRKTQKTDSTRATVGRRLFLTGAGAAAIGLSWWYVRSQAPVSAEAASAGLPKTVTIVERPYTNEDPNNHAKGIFRCICCDTALFDSSTKFQSGTGWPSFWEPIAKENVRETTDSSLGMIRTAVSCRLCDAHLGHVFEDGPKPTGLRYCMNSVAMRFAKAS